ncbi:SDR family NAD(P)-dependent oxidoreductase [Paracoccus sp. 1_MG-2023]|uniref:SDR family NAD(P)-dependent oxidoreductase n=1 Tax=unclassified Paracoccus (in: a-proteobacteria) TaxID=2688777 RepID=UPI001C083644|nr:MULTISPECIES: SDR family NAD(P)-dependent oxidoreductase [unclassified Paracoccus (in: a-proteobacteria)]MBU2956242.1 SDR family NAD(P)-dependent oxidoreductase [Paracoccus sp. C2R09]MDO6667919.1 SDR family NAD(P)-dependent oxidoreductase [Paracoccus sp. 1_MG-2023]
MRDALIIGASGGIGQAMTRLLQARGVAVTGLSRSADGLDLTDGSSVAEHGQALAGRSFDLILNTTGALVIDGHQPEKTTDAIDADAMAAQFALNATGAALTIRHFAPLLHRDGRAVFGSLSARVGSIGDNRLGGWVAYRAAKAAQNQILRTAAIEWKRRNRHSIFVALHPGTVETPLTAKYAARHPTITPDRSAEALLGVIEGLTPEDTGSFWDWKGQRVPW